MRHLLCGCGGALSGLCGGIVLSSVLEGGASGGGSWVGGEEASVGGDQKGGGKVK